MNHRKILTRAWTLVTQYRVLWVFGFLLALAGGESGFRSFNGSSGGGNNNGGNNSGPFPNFHWPTIDWAVMAWIVAGLVVLILVLAIIGLIVRYVSDAALMLGVDEIESTGASFTVRHGFSLGWSAAGRLFLNDLAIYLPLFIGAILLIGIGALPLLFWFTHIKALGILATLVTVALELLVFLSLIAFGLVLSLVMPYIRRRVVLHKQGVRTAVRESVHLVRATLVDTGLMWLLLAGLRIVWALVMIPVGIVVVLVALVIGGIPALIAYLITQSWVAPAVIGGILFVLVTVPAIAFVEGLFMAYVSAAWTLAYREVVGKLGDVPALPVVPVAPSPEALSGDALPQAI